MAHTPHRCDPTHDQHTQDQNNRSTKRTHAHPHGPSEVSSGTARAGDRRVPCNAAQRSPRSGTFRPLGGLQAAAAWACPAGPVRTVLAASQLPDCCCRLRRPVGSLGACSSTATTCLFPPVAGGSLREKKRSIPERQFPKKTACSSYVQRWLVAIGGWRLVTGGWWRLVGIGGWRLATGGWWQLVVVGGGWWLVIGGWWRSAVVGAWRLVAAGGWRLVAVGGWWLAVSGPLGRSLTKKHLVLSGPPCPAVISISRRISLQEGHMAAFRTTWEQRQASWERRRRRKGRSGLETTPTIFGGAWD